MVMNFWMFLTVVVVIEALVGMMIKLARIKSQAAIVGAERTLSSQEMLERLEKIEKRLSNLETIVLESEKKRDFESLF
jgi:hypothetical protein